MTPHHEIDDNSVVFPTAEFDVNELSGEAVVYDGCRKRVHVLNKSARIIWEACDGTRTVKDIVAVLGNAYPEAPGPRITEDVRTALAKLSQEGLVRLEKGNP